MADPVTGNWLTRNWKYIALGTALIGWGISAVLALQKGEPIPAPPPLIVDAGEEFRTLGVRDYTPTTGWVKDLAVIENNLNEEKTLHFHNTAAGKAALGDDDVFLWRGLRKVNPTKPPKWYPNINQLSVGCCVGAGFKHGADVCQVFPILNGSPHEWKPISAEVIYGGSRVEVGGGRISGDGSVGAWAAKWVKDYGVVPMDKYGNLDLTTFSPARARELGKRGVPDEIEAVAKLHPVKGTALVKSWVDCKRAVTQGYPVAVCSDQGFRMERDATGKARPQGSWAHCMCIIGIRSGPNEGGFILNSWGDDAHTGPVWPEDAPVAGFWADASVIDSMLRQGDSFALSDIVGFPTRKVPDWFVSLPERPLIQPVRGLFALAP